MAEDCADLVERADRARLGGRLDEARALLDRAVALGPGGDRALFGRALAALGRIERDRGEGEAALGHYREAAAIAREEGDSLACAHRLRHAGDIEREAGRLELAEPCYDEALAIYRSRPDTPPLDLANALRPLALLRERRGAPSAAAALWAEAKALYAEAGIPSGVAEAARRGGGGAGAEG